MIQVSQASDDLTPQSSLAAGTVRILSGSELADGLMLAPGPARLLRTGARCLESAQEAVEEPELGLVTNEHSKQWLASLSP